MKILGIDPGTRIVGYAVIESIGESLVSHSHGAIKTKPKNALPKRLYTIFHNLIDIIEKYKPDVVATEKVFYGKNIKSAIRIGEGRGVAFLAAAQSGLEVYEYDATKIKKAVTGVGNAHKSQIQHMVTTIFNLKQPPTPFDAADALAIATCHYNNISLCKL